MHYGLIGAGPVSQYFVERLPRLSQQLGSVAASSFRLASRIVNTLRAGQACRNIDAFGATALVLICAPDNHIGSLLPLLRQTTLEWQGRMLVLCDSTAYSRELEFLRKRGASVASLHSLPGRNPHFIVEGDRDALRQARELVRQVHGAAVEVRSDRYALFRASCTMAASLLTPLLESCALALRGAGMSGTLPAQVTEALFSDALRAYMYSGRKSWSGTVAAGDDCAMRQDVEALTAFKPQIADLYQAMVPPACRLLTPATTVPEKT